MSTNSQGERSERRLPELSAEAKSELKRWMCLGCGFLYDEALGLPEEGIPPGTRWEELPEDWVCPDCGTPKEMFEMVMIGYAQSQRSAERVP